MQYLLSREFFWGNAGLHVCTTGSRQHFYELAQNTPARLQFSVFTSSIFYLQTSNFKLFFLRTFHIHINTVSPGSHKLHPVGALLRSVINTSGTYLDTHTCLVITQNNQPMTWRSADILREVSRGLFGGRVIFHRNVHLELSGVKFVFFWWRGRTNCQGRVNFFKGKCWGEFQGLSTVNVR